MEDHHQVGCRALADGALLLVEIGAANHLIFERAEERIKFQLLAFVF